MEWPGHLENSQWFGTATKKRTFETAGSADSLSTDLGYTGSSKKPCTAYDAASQPLQDGDFTASSTGNMPWIIELSGQPTTSSSSAGGTVSLNEWDASVPWQNLGTGVHTMLDMCKSKQLHLSSISGLR